MQHSLERKKTDAAFTRQLPTTAQGCELYALDTGNLRKISAVKQKYLTVAKSSAIIISECAFCNTQNLLEFLYREDSAIDIEKIRLAELLVYYGSLLTQRQREIAELYYCDDLSLSEIAEMLAVSRQAVAASLNTAKAELVQYESRLHHIQLVDELSKLHADIASVCTASANSELCSVAERIEKILDKL